MNNKEKLYLTKVAGDEAFNAFGKKYYMPWQDKASFNPMKSFVADSMLGRTGIAGRVRPEVGRAGKVGPKPSLLQQARNNSPAMPWDDSPNLQEANAKEDVDSHMANMPTNEQLSANRNDWRGPGRDLLREPQPGGGTQGISPGQVEFGGEEGPMTPAPGYENGAHDLGKWVGSQSPQYMGGTDPNGIDASSFKSKISPFTKPFAPIANAITAPIGAIGKGIKGIFGSTGEEKDWIPPDGAPGTWNDPYPGRQPSSTMAPTQAPPTQTPPTQTPPTQPWNFGGQ